MLNHNRQKVNQAQAAGTLKASSAKPTPVDLDSLPITQELVLEALSARLRTGDRLYALPAKAVNAARALQRLGLVTVLDGNQPRSFRARLTDAGVKATISPTYETPIERELRMVRAQLKELRELRDLEREHRSGPTW